MVERHLVDLGRCTVGELFPLIGTFRDADGMLADPDDVTLTLRPPDGSEARELIPTSDETGIWTAEADVDVPGRWTLRWEGTGAVADVEQATFLAHPSVLA